MKVIMEKVSILLSIYKPNLTYLALQLNSLNNQDYENLEVIINDDCPESPCPIYIFEQYLTKVPYKILKQNKSNLNYIKSFEKLVKNSDGKYELENLKIDNKEKEIGGQAGDDVQKENDNKENESELENEKEKGTSMRKKAPWERRMAS